MAIRFLIVDDTRFMRVMLTDILKKLDHEVVGEADNGHKAIELYKELQPDIVFMDISMPEMDGIEALSKIREINPESIIIICSGTSQQERISEAMEIGANAYIMKPFKPKEIKGVIRKFGHPFMHDDADRKTDKSGAQVAERGNDTNSAANSKTDNHEAAESDTPAVAESKTDNHTAAESNTTAVAESKTDTVAASDSKANVAQDEERQSNSHVAHHEKRDIEFNEELEVVAVTNGASRMNGLASEQSMDVEAGAAFMPDATSDMMPTPLELGQWEDQEESSSMHAADMTISPFSTSQQDPSSESFAEQLAEADETNVDTEKLNAAEEDAKPVTEQSSSVEKDAKAVSEQSSSVEKDTKDEQSSTVVEEPKVAVKQTMAEVVPIHRPKSSAKYKGGDSVLDFTASYSCSWKEKSNGADVNYEVSFEEGDHRLYFNVTGLTDDKVFFTMEGLRHLMKWLDSKTEHMSPSVKEMADK